MRTDRDAILDQIAGWLDAGQAAAVATVIATWGSSPRPVGSLLAVNRDGAFAGSVSGGCIEGAVITEAQAAIADGKPRLLSFGVSDEQAWQVGLSCGGEVKVHVRPAENRPILERIRHQRPLALVTRLADAAQAQVDFATVAGELSLDAATIAQVRQALADDLHTLLGGPDGALFVQSFNTPLRMIVVGAVHITQALVPLAQIAGFAVTVVDPRGAFATRERFPEATLSDDWPDDALTLLKPDHRTAVVTLSHDPKIDDPALEVALRSPAYYIGSLGSRKTHAKRVQRLAERGFTEADIARIHGPAGLDLGAKSPAEIAVSVVAEAIAARYGKAPRR